MVVIWSIRGVQSSVPVNVIAKAHTDVDITRMRIAFFDDTRSVVLPVNSLCVLVHVCCVALVLSFSYMYVLAIASLQNGVVWA